MKRKNSDIKIREVFKLTSILLLITGIFLAGANGALTLVGGGLFILSLPGVILAANERF